MIRTVTLNDAHQLAEIYNHYVLNSIITFDEIPSTITDFEEKIKTIYNNYPFFVFEENNDILGYAYANVWRLKPAYKHTAEITVYVKHDQHGKQFGSKLYTKLLQNLKQQNYHAIIGGVSLPNDGSIMLHEKFGFQKVAHFKAVGRKFNKWIDVAFWQLIF